jgi:nitrogen fixation protein FixH
MMIAPITFKGVGISLKMIIARMVDPTGSPIVAIATYVAEMYFNDQLKRE